LVVDAAVSLQDFESSLIAPGGVPGVDAEPVVLAVLGAVANHLDSVATFRFTCLMRVDSRLVSKEIHVDSESRCEGPVSYQLLLDVVDANNLVAGLTLVLVVRVLNQVV